MKYGQQITIASNCKRPGAQSGLNKIMMHTCNKEKQITATTTAYFWWAKTGQPKCKQTIQFYVISILWHLSYKILGLIHFVLMMTLIIITSFYTSDILNGGLPRVAKNA